MRVHITLDDRLVAELDRRVGVRERSRFIARALRRSLDEADRRDAAEAALDSIPDSGHEWDDDPAGWVRRQRADERRSG
jgi:Arc/MetJ family transcription regulator